MGMVHVVFVHGTSVRRKRYDELFHKVQEALLGESERDDLTVVPCYWGDKGAELPDPPQSIPCITPFTTHRSGTVPHYDSALWSILLHNPLYELYMLCLRPECEDCDDDEEQGVDLLERFRVIPPPQQALSLLHITPEQFEEAREDILEDEAVQHLLERAAPPLSDFQFALARATLSIAIRDGNKIPFEKLVVRPNDVADHAVNSFVKALGGSGKRIPDWLRTSGARMIQALSAATMPFAIETLTERIFLPKRSTLSRPASTFFADIFKYQANGGEMRGTLESVLDLIPSREITKDGIEKETTVVLAHSLGGIISLDTLILNAARFPHVKQLITFGSQAPLFYEWDALFSLRYGEPVPDHFPAWTNFYDYRDPLAYVGGNAFSANGPEDVPINSSSNLVSAHNAYFDLPEFWEQVLRRLPRGERRKRIT